MHITRLSINLALVLFSASIFAHTPLKLSTPSDNALLENAPKTLVLTFREAVTLARVELSKNKDEKIAIDFKPSAKAAADYSIALPALGAGEYQVNWVAVGADTHKIDGTVNFTIQAKAGAGGEGGSPAQSHDGQSHDAHDNHHDQH